MQRSTLFNYGAVKIGAVFRSLTLLKKDGGIWLMRCCCAREREMKRDVVVKGKRVTCGECKDRRLYRRKSKAALQRAPKRLRISGFRAVEKRRMENGASWRIFRRVSGPVVWRLE